MPNSLDEEAPPYENDLDITFVNLDNNNLGGKP